jgi:serine/threonine protein kinase
MQAGLPFVAPIVGVHEDERTQLVISEYVTGGDLSRRFKKPWRLKQVLNLCQQVLAALSVTHAMGFFHGNLRPENILFDVKGQVLLTDFGCQSHHNQCTGALVITNPGESPSHQADLFALGVIAYRLVVGQTARFISGTLHPQEAFDTLPKSFRQVIERLLATEVKQRYGCADQVLAELKACSAGIVTKMPPPAPVEPRRFIRWPRLGKQPADSSTDSEMVGPTGGRVYVRAFGFFVLVLVVITTGLTWHLL